MENVLHIAIALLVAKVLGELAERLKMPSLIGYLAAGMILANFGLIDPELIEIFGVIGLILLLFLAAFEEANTEEILKNKFTSIFFAVGGGGLVNGIRNFGGSFIWIGLDALGVYWNWSGSNFD